MFEKEITEQEDSAKESVTQRIVESVDRPETEVLEESIYSPAPIVESSVGGYLNEMKKLDGSKLNIKH